MTDVFCGHRVADSAVPSEKDLTVIMTSHKTGRRGFPFSLSLSSPPSPSKEIKCEKAGRHLSRDTSTTVSQYLTSPEDHTAPPLPSELPFWKIRGLVFRFFILIAD